MYQYYRNSLLRLHKMLHEIQANPVSQRQNCLLCQEKLLERIVYMENRIRKCREELKGLKRQLGSKTVPLLSKSEAGLIKTRIRQCNQRIGEYQFLIMTFKSIADGLAFIYIDKWDIKPMVFKESSGFISKKMGLRNELRFLRHVFSKGGVGILNDLTTCLHTGDVCVALEKTPYIFEIKSGQARNARAKRQRKHIEDVHQYLDSDKATSLYGVDGDFRRITLHHEEVNHIDKFNSIVASARASTGKYCLKEVEDGLYYGATYVEDDHMFDPIIKKRPGKLIISMVNEWKRSTVGYYPFSLSFRDSDEWYDFCLGELIILIAVDYEVIQQKLLSVGLSMKYNPDPDWSLESYIEISDVNSNSEFKKILIGGHFFGRLFTEFLSLNWFIQSIIDRMKSIESNY